MKKLLIATYIICTMASLSLIWVLSGNNIPIRYVDSRYDGTMYRTDDAFDLTSEEYKEQACMLLLDTNALTEPAHPNMRVYVCGSAEDIDALVKRLTTKEQRKKVFEEEV